MSLKQDFVSRDLRWLTDGTAIEKQVTKVGYKWPYAHPGSRCLCPPYSPRGTCRCPTYVTAGWLASVVRSHCYRGKVAYFPEDPETVVSAVVLSAACEIVWAHTEFSLRQMGICGELCKELGLDFSKPVGVLIWTPSASRVAARGYRIYPVPFEPEGERSNDEERDRGPRGGH